MSKPLGVEGALKLEGWLRSGCQTSDRMDDAALRAEARAVVPVATLRERHAAVPHDGDDEHDGLVRQLLAWFKFEFFRWVNQPPCDACGGATRSVGSAPPTADDLAGGAHRVELYACTRCGSHVRFPRYNSARRLLVTRRGRCGEWANAFTLLCRALGVCARYVHDVTDHVWTEVWSARRNRWLHADPCENVLDGPLLYSVGWRKQLSHVLAFAPGEAVDVTNRYVTADGGAAALARRRATVTEAYLAARLALLDTERRAALPAAERRARDARRTPDARELAAPAVRAAPTAVEGRGRQTGSVEWRAARGELGDGGAAAGAGSGDGGEPCAVPTVGPSHEWLARLPAGRAGEWRLRYSAARDAYVEGGPEGPPLASAPPTLRGWRAGAASADNVRRAVENDWNMVYLARDDDATGATRGAVEWRVVAERGARIVGGSALLAHSLHAEGAAVRWRLSRDDGVSWRTLGAPRDAAVDLTRALAAADARGARSHAEPRDGCRTLRLRAELGGGTWQSAQLFRQSRTQLHVFHLDLRLNLARDAAEEAAAPAAAGGAACAPAASVVPNARGGGGGDAAGGSGSSAAEPRAVEPTTRRALFERLFAAISEEARWRDDPSGAAAETIRRMARGAG
ncbi:hypothetical protein KFE25_013314 [Diacronema lutheri]|uniref:Peptide-N(4)-(N-acetyl-beta-glucosaminyl)asparagine amidase n=1 Tax=Diacronema lutheri TaxID=2081491 RepID=A0A8J6CEL4_DIALT|nr:hypothetical protein KFE25_013314 [Diacronema lutheri]